MRSPRFSAWLLAVLPLACAGSLPEGVVVRIGGEDKSYEDFDRYVMSVLHVDASRSSSEVLSRLFERFVDDELLLRWARDRGLADEAATSHEAAASVLEASPLEISSTDVERYYAEHRSDYQRPSRARLRQILVEDRASAEQALAELEAGVDFGEVARIRSIGPSAPDGGLQGELSREDLPGALADVVFALEEGEWSELLEADYGFRIFQVEDLLAAETLSLEAAAPSIRSRLVAERSEALIRQAIEEARREYNLQIAVSRLPFEYSGPYSEPAAE
ncbi:MAG: peptidylprolyl isomerase [Acidobacteriota bacterium]|nr:peptidylprolyl isomerase [Acidobacteriota bacterium]